MVGCVGCPAVSYQRTEIQARDAFQKGYKGEQVLVLVDGGPGCGKTKATNTLAQALELVGITAAYTGSTGTAATNYPGGFTLHGMMGFGFDTRVGVGFRKFYTKDTTRRKIKKRLGNNQAKKILLVIDEISALSYSIQFASTLGWSVVRRGLGKRHTSRFVNSRISVHLSPPILGAFRVSSILVCRGFCIYEDRDGTSSYFQLDRTLRRRECGFGRGFRSETSGRERFKPGTNPRQSAYIQATTYRLEGGQTTACSKVVCYVQEIRNDQKSSTRRIID